MYNGENHMVLGSHGGYQYAPEDPDTIKERATISVITDIVNIGRWQGYKKWDEDICLDDAYYGFFTEVEVDCLYEEDWDDDMGRCAVAKKDDLEEQVWQLVCCIDPDADYFIE